MKFHPPRNFKILSRFADCACGVQIQLLKLSSIEGEIVGANVNVGHILRENAKCGSSRK